MTPTRIQGKWKLWWAIGSQEGAYLLHIKDAPVPPWTHRVIVADNPILAESPWNTIELVKTARKGVWHTGWTCVPQFYSIRQHQGRNPSTRKDGYGNHPIQQYFTASQWIDAWKREMRQVEDEWVDCGKMTTILVISFSSQNWLPDWVGLFPFM